MRAPAILFASYLFIDFFAATACAEPWTEPLTKLREVGPEGKGNAEAAEAWRELVDQGPETIIPILQSMENAGPLAGNWMRSAAETVFEREFDAGGELPAEGIERFLLDRENDPEARRLAFDFYAKIGPEAAADLVPGMIDDPNPSLRRDAVARLIEKGERLIANDETDDSIEVLGEALGAARDVDQIDAAAKLLREDLNQNVDLPKHFGFLMRWHLVAPFDNTGLSGFETVFPPEEGVDLDASYEGKDGQAVSWQRYSTSNDYGMVDFNQPFSPLKEVVGYAYTEFDSAENRTAQLRLGCKNAWKIWLNDELLFGRDEYHRGIRIDQYVLPVQLKKGKNTLLVKACQSKEEHTWTAQWEFQLRVCDETGTAILSTDRKPTPQPESKPRRRSNN
ncbi:MAG: hypothetical protein WD342_20765 [Verrucomicrobiales bacterium]